MPEADRGTPLRGRRSECEALDRLLARVRAGQSGVLVLRGEAGVGKTALLEYLAGARVGVPHRASGGRRVGDGARVRGPASAVRADARRARRGCPARSRMRCGSPSGCSEGATPDHFLVALAVLSLLAEAAEAQPLVCLIDDVQWLDRASAQALSFVARRLLAERIAMVFAVREPSHADGLAGLPELAVQGLADDDARALLAAALPGALDERIRDRIVAETRGNPLALIELPRGLTPAELAGGFGLPDAGPLSGRIEQSFLRRFESLPPGSQRLLLTAAAEPVGDVDAVVAGGRATRDRSRRRRAGRGGRADRARRPGALPPSAGALGGVPGGTRARAPGGAPRAGRGDRPRGGSGSPRMASRARGRRSRRGGRRRAGALGRPRPAPRRRRGRGRVPRASGRADPGPGTTRSARASPPRRPSWRREAARRRRRCSRPRS